MGMPEKTETQGACMTTSKKPAVRVEMKLQSGLCPQVQVKGLP